MRKSYCTSSYWKSHCTDSYWKSYCTSSYWKSYCTASYWKSYCTASYSRHETYTGLCYCKTSHFVIARKNNKINISCIENNKINIGVNKNWLELLVLVYFIYTAQFISNDQHE